MKQPDNVSANDKGAVSPGIVDIEQHAKSNGGKAPPAQQYRIRIDKENYVVNVSTITGRELLELAKKTPVDHWMLNMKVGGQIRPVGLDEQVDLTAPGVERFMTLPKDQTEGRENVLRQFNLPEEDTEALNAEGLPWEAIIDNGPRWVLVHGIVLPEKLTPSEVSIAISIPSGYPSAALDMAYFHPPIQRVDGHVIPATQCSVRIQDKAWQRWSRHYSPTHPWKMGEYNVVTHLHLARNWIQKEAAK